MLNQQNDFLETKNKEGKGNQISTYTEAKTQFKNAKTLIECLKDLGLTAEDISANPRVCVEEGDYWKSSQKASIIVPRQQNGLRADMGFALGKDGTYSMISNSDDARRFNGQWITNLKNSYAEKTVMASAAKMGFKYAGKKVIKKGKMSYVFVQA